MAIIGIAVVAVTIGITWASGTVFNWSGDPPVPEYLPTVPDHQNPSNEYLVVYTESNGEILGMLSYVPCSCSSDPTPALGPGEGVLDVTEDALLEDFLDWWETPTDTTVWTVNVGEQELQHD